MEQTEWMIGLVTSFVVLVAVLKSRAIWYFDFWCRLFWEGF